MNPSKFPKNPTAPWRVMVPKKWSPSGKRWPHYFRTEKEAEVFCRKVKREGVRAFDNAERPKGVAPVLTKNQEEAWLSAVRVLVDKLGTTDVGVLYEAADQWKEHRSLKGGLLADIVEKFLSTPRISPRTGQQVIGATLNGNRQRLKRLLEYFPNTEITAITEGMMQEFFDNLTVNRGAVFSTTRLLFNFAYRRSYIARNPFDKIETIVDQGVHNQYMEIDDFFRLLQITAGLPDPKGEVEPTNGFGALLPFLILGGFGGLRPSEACRYREDRDALRWSDLHFDVSPPRIGLRHGVSKTAKVGETDWVMKPYAIEAIKAWLPLVRHSDGTFITPVAYRSIEKLRSALRKLTGITIPEDGLRNSAATYGLSYDGEEGVEGIAKWLRHDVKILKRYYLRFLPDGTGQKWFALRPQTAFVQPITEIETEQAA
jgi:integrase